MASLNRIILIGRISSEPEVRSTLEGIPIAKFSMSVDRMWGNSQPKQADIFDVVAWRNLADICGKYLKKSQMALVEGRIQTRSFENQEGVKKYVTEVVAKDVVFLDKGMQKELVPEKEIVETESGAVDDVEFLADDLPF